jgi:hypothetical protein
MTNKGEINNMKMKIQQEIYKIFGKKEANEVIYFEEMNEKDEGRYAVGTHYRVKLSDGCMVRAVILEDFDISIISSIAKKAKKAGFFFNFFTKNRYQFRSDSAEQEAQRYNPVQLTQEILQGKKGKLFANFSPENDEANKEKLKPIFEKLKKCGYLSHISSVHETKDPFVVSREYRTIWS